MTVSGADPVHRNNKGKNSPCPFCPGDHYDAPPALYQIPAEGDDWQLRVVPNKYPAVTANNDKGFGHHECIIDTARHICDPTEYTHSETANVIRCIKDRVNYFSTVDTIQHVTPFKNVGAEAGASLSHAHTQIIAMPFVPAQMVEEITHTEKTYSITGICPFQDMLHHHKRIIAQTDHFVAACPYAPRNSYEFWILPKQASAHIGQLPDAQIPELAAFLPNCLRVLDNLLNYPAYNLVFHTAPYHFGPKPFFRWHIEVLPRMARAAGFEWGSGVFINAVPPEQAAQDLADRMTE